MPTSVTLGFIWFTIYGLYRTLLGVCPLSRARALVLTVPVVPIRCEEVPCAWLSWFWRRCGDRDASATVVLREPAVAQSDGVSVAAAA